MAAKTPVSVLRELCTKLNITETYSVVSSYGPPNDPIFEMSVETSNGLKAVGKGKKKKEAQHYAAQALLDVMKDKGMLSITSQITTTSMNSPVPPITARLSSLTFMSNPSAANLPSLNATENSVGRLQEMCQQKNWPLPVYTCLGSEGDPHQPTFTMKCEVGQHSATGVSRTKQQAKQEAANAMHHIILTYPVSRVVGAAVQQVPLLPPTPKLSDAEKTAIIETYSLCKPLTSVPKTNPSLKFGEYHTSMQNLLVKVRSDLDKQHFSSPVETLEAITKKLGVKVFYHEGLDITFKELRNEKCFVYAIVSTQPTTVQVGKGQSTNVATIEAALSVLKYWQTFLGIIPVM